MSIPPPTDDRPHSRACGIGLHPHGPQCAPDCPTCGVHALGPSTTPSDWPPIQEGAPITEPCIAVPADFTGTDAEAVALAVAGAVQHIALQRDSWESYCRSTRDALAELVKTFPATSFAVSNVALEGAQKWLAFISQHLDPPKPGAPT